MAPTLGSTRAALNTATFFLHQAQAQLPALQKESLSLLRIIESVHQRTPIQKESAMETARAFPAFKNNLEAAIVFGRTVTFHLQAEFSHIQGFGPWYSEQRNFMEQDPLFTFFLDETEGSHCASYKARVCIYTGRRKAQRLF